MQNYTYSPPLHHGDPYRQSSSMAPVQPVNLPPLRIDGHIQHHQAYSQPQHPQMPSPPMTGYYTQAQPIMYHNQHLSHMPQGPYRTYGIPISHTRSNKKEIKRRTKTGCMTCRKRRIKCDEQKPVCRNCVKSKRECQGYDPLYKNQPGNGPGQQQRNSSTASGCCTPKPSQSQRPISPPASTSSASTTTASSPTTAAIGITTPSSSVSYCSSSSSGAGSIMSTAPYSHPSYSNTPLPHSYSAAPVSQSYSAAPITQSYATASITQPYSTASLPQYSTPSMSQSYTLPSPLSSSRHSPLPSYYSTNANAESMHAVSGGRNLPAMTRSIHGMPIY